jgi:hypothetical protein
MLPALLAAGATDTTPVQRKTADPTTKRAKVAGEKIGPQIAPQSVIRIPLVLIVGPIPVRLVSEANRGGKLRDRIARKTAVKDAVRAALPAMAFSLPVRVTLTRYGHKRQDDDNLRRTLKSVRDVVAEWLGVDDADKRVRWVYRDRPGWGSGVGVEFRTLGGCQ